MKTIGFPSKFSRTPAQIRSSAPLFAQHTDEVLEQFYLQHAEHYYRQIDHSNRGSVSRKIISKEKSQIDQAKNNDVAVDQQKSTTDFDDLASQLA